MQIQTKTILSLLNIYSSGCGKGYYAAQTGSSTFDRTCMICPRGTYRDTDTAYSCIQCQSGFTTIHEGSTNSSNCQTGKIIFSLAHFWNFEIKMIYLWR